MKIFGFGASKSNGTPPAQSLYSQTWVKPIIQANNRSIGSRYLVIVESQGFDEKDWLTWESNDKLVKFIETLLSTTSVKPDTITLYRWVDESCVVLEFKWE